MRKHRIFMVTIKIFAILSIYSLVQMIRLSNELQNVSQKKFSSYLEKLSFCFNFQNKKDFETSYESKFLSLEAQLKDQFINIPWEFLQKFEMEKINRMNSSCAKLPVWNSIHFNNIYWQV